MLCVVVTRKRWLEGMYVHVEPFLTCFIATNNNRLRRRAASE